MNVGSDMRAHNLSVAMLLAIAAPLASQDTAKAPDPAARLVARLDLERYKATIKGLTQFGDRRQGTARNRAAVDWIEQQLRSYGCSDVARITYQFPPAQTEPRTPRDTTRAAGGGKIRGLRAPNAEPTTPGQRQEVYCTKIGTGHPNEMYIVGAHMDGHGWGEAANDDGSGTAIVMELARIFS